jgi:drug/metabolite transporter (DMT)-like permease
LKTQKHIFLILIGTIFLLGISWPINKIGLHYMSPIAFSVGRLVIATVLTFLIVIMTRQFIWPGRKDWPMILAVGIFQIGIFVLLMNMGLSLMDVGRSTILVYTTPIWVTPMAVFLFKESAGFLKWLGLLLGILGMMTLFSPWGVNWTDPNDIAGNLFLLLAALSWAISILCIRYMKWEHSPLALLPWQLLIGTIPILCLLLFEDQTQVIHWNGQLVSILLFAGIFTQAIVTLGLMTVGKVLPSATTSLSLLAVPILSLFFSALLLGEKLTLVNGIAMLFLILGLICTALDSKNVIRIKS